MSIAYNHTPHYSKNDAADIHFKILREQVKQVLDELPASRLRIMRYKAFFLPAAYFGIYVAALFQTNYFLFCLAYILLGFMLVIIFLNLIHEASHNTLLKGKRNNQRYMFLFDLIGANSYMWHRRHIKLHHNFTNVNGWDSDIEKSKFLKVHPFDYKKPRHQYQHLLIFLYPLFITNWFLLRDFKYFFNPKMIVRKLGNPPWQEYVKLFFFKFLFVGYLVVVPVLITPFQWWHTALALFIMLLSAGFFALTVLLPPHVNTSNQFPVVNAEMKLQQSWLMHQLNTTNDVTTSNWITKHIMANCNCHIAHHLFPNISHVYAKEVTAAISKYSMEAGLPYRSYPLFTTLKNHYRLIKTNGRWIDILEEDM
jgi:linoleoyl-CoA desaturase